MEQKKDNKPEWWYFYSPKKGGRYTYLWWGSIILLIFFAFITKVFPHFSATSYISIPLIIIAFIGLFVFRFSWIHWAFYNRPFKTRREGASILSYSNFWISLILFTTILLMPKIFPWIPFPNFSWFYFLLIIIGFVALIIFNKIKNK